VESFAHAHFAGIIEAIYVSTPITTGRAYFEVLRIEGVVSSKQHEQLRAINENHAQSVIEHVRTAFPGRRVIDPLGIVERTGWTQDDFNGLWMWVIHNAVTTVVLVDGWQYSTGCTWEVSQAIHDGLLILDERLEPFTAGSLVEHLNEASSFIADGTTWAPARDAVLRLLSKSNE
jgi:hypothetical protein